MNGPLGQSPRGPLSNSRDYQFTRDVIEQVFVLDVVHGHATAVPVGSLRNGTVRRID